MSRLVHEDGEAELPAADDEEGDDHRERVRPAGDQGEGGSDRAPIDRDREPRAPVAQREQLAQLGVGERLAPGFGHQPLNLSAARRPHSTAIVT